ncbi:zinc carboxypeptidase family protein, putative (macronuclear) [Tetrahymena thermophila SB210]|uniref:Zinc carboxypeptidase family protein, putative n=1 Tax=Tetrahymena thermophila (strain SB210) TaxID=312017 RepID=Q24C92_TETTS|nr:zinc carboxypeptidase family protein, putative [Tetrahymena thermophila SB210]EAS05346.1 zinc carboxypeptidase family protein, putative [Tetrahymena thermophila SB210]|eukprot:XP_001025591.1 zinc carboxypeptidase family protein, putative [Tetrahymena thermophila SB210]
MSRTFQSDQQQQVPDVLELDHLIGFNGKNSNTCFYHPLDQKKIIYSVGGLVVIENSEDKHDQQFLRGHDMPISSLAVSPSGNYIASGQIGSKFTQTREAPIILWDYNRKKAIQVFKGMREGVTNLSFSHDDKFLAATGQNNTITIWNTQDFSIVHNKVLECQVSLIQWGAPRKSANKYNSYILITANGPNLLINTLDFNVGSMQYTLKSTNCQLPSSGLIRTYTKAIVDSNSNYIFVGTTAGEVCVYSINNQIFKAAIPVSNNGVLSIALFQDILFVGSGDGRLKKLRGSETKWSLESEVQLDGAITSISPINDFKELIIGTSQNNIYRVLTQSVNAMLHTESHLASIQGIAFPNNRNEFFATIDLNGYTYIWDNNEMNVITKFTPGQMMRTQGTCITIAEDETIVNGYSDGFVRAFQVSNKQYSPLKWEIVNAHKGAVTSVFANQNYILTGGQDGIVRVWSRVNRQLITQISMHTKDVVSVFPDFQKANIIHSCSADKSVHSFDLKTDKKVIFHQAKNGSILDMSQRKDHEQELVTCGLNIPILQWDCDVQEPVESINYPDRLNTVEVSPSGRYMALGSDLGEVVIFEIASKRFQGKYLGHSSGISKLKWTPDEKQIVSVSSDSTICIWNFFP